MRVHKPTVGFYRYLYDTVGAQYAWWLRRTMPPAQLAALITAPGVSLHVLYQGNEPAGFFELDARAVHTVNLAYFGLLPHAIGGGLGTALLRAAMATAWAHKPRALTVNTCTADPPARSAELPARRVHAGAYGARDLGRAGSSGAADTGASARLISTGLIVDP